MIAALPLTATAPAPAADRTSAPRAGSGGEDSFATVLDRALTTGQDAGEANEAPRARAAARDDNAKARSESGGESAEASQGNIPADHAVGSASVELAALVNPAAVSAVPLTPAQVAQSDSSDSHASDPALESASDSASADTLLSASPLAAAAASAVSALSIADGIGGGISAGAKPTQNALPTEPLVAESSSSSGGESVAMPAAVLASVLDEGGEPALATPPIQPNPVPARDVPAHDLPGREPSAASSATVLPPAVPGPSIPEPLNQASSASEPPAPMSLSQLPAVPLTVSQPVPAATPTAAASQPAPTIPVPLPQQIGTALAHLRTAPSGEHVMVVRIHPEEFGPVRVTAHLGTDGVRIELAGATDQAREALRGALGELRRELATVGLQADLSLASSSRGNQQADPFGSGPAADGGDRTAGQDGMAGSGEEAVTTPGPVAAEGARRADSGSDNQLDLLI